MISLAVVLGVLVVTQGNANPLRKSDIVRLLSAAAISPTELADLVTRTCLTFDPTERDRTDFRRTAEFGNSPFDIGQWNFVYFLRPRSAGFPLVNRVRPPQGAALNDVGIRCGVPGAICG